MASEQALPTRQRRPSTSAPIVDIQGSVGPAGVSRPKHKRTFTGFGAGEIKSVEGESRPFVPRWKWKKKKKRRSLPTKLLVLAAACLQASVLPGSQLACTCQAAPVLGGGGVAGMQPPSLASKHAAARRWRHWSTATSHAYPAAARQWTD